MQVFLVSAAPPVRYPNVYGIDIPTRTELVAYNRSPEEVKAVYRCAGGWEWGGWEWTQRLAPALSSSTVLQTSTSQIPISQECMEVTCSPQAAPSLPSEPIERLGCRERSPGAHPRTQGCSADAGFGHGGDSDGTGIPRRAARGTSAWNRVLRVPWAVEVWVQVLASGHVESLPSLPTEPGQGLGVRGAGALEHYEGSPKPAASVSSLKSITGFSRSRP